VPDVSASVYRETVRDVFLDLVCTVMCSRRSRRKMDIRHESTLYPVSILHADNDSFILAEEAGNEMHPLVYGARRLAGDLSARGGRRIHTR